MPSPTIQRGRDFSGGLSEANFIIREALRNGLCPDPRMGRNSPYASEMVNLEATPYAAATALAITNPITSGPTPNWATTGVVQMFRGEAGRFVLGQTRAYTATASWVASAIGSTFTAGGPWQFVSFLDYTVFTNGTVYFFSPPGATSTPTVNTTPTINAVGKDNNRLLLGGISGTAMTAQPFATLFQRWKDTQEGDRLSYSDQVWTTGWILFGERGGGFSDYPYASLWAALGRYTFPSNKDTLNQILESHLEQYKLGMCPLRYPGAVYAFHELEDAPMAFGQNGVSRLVREGNIYTDTRLHAIGIAGRGAVGGDLLECVFVDSAGELWRIKPGGVPTRANALGGFRAYIGTLTKSDITVSFDPQERSYWIADKTKGYLLNGEKLSGPFDVFPSSLVRENDALYGVIRDTRSDTSKTTVRFSSMPLDMNERGTKQITCLQVEQEGIAALKGGCDYRTNDLGSYAAGPRSQATKESAIFPYPRVEFSDGKVVVQGTVATSGRIEQITVRYQKSGHAFLRGTVGTPEGA